MVGEEPERVTFPTREVKSPCSSSAHREPKESTEGKALEVRHAMGQEIGWDFAAMSIFSHWRISEEKEWDIQDGERVPQMMKPKEPLGMIGKAPQRSREVALLAPETFWKAGWGGRGTLRWLGQLTSPQKLRFS